MRMPEKPIRILYVIDKMVRAGAQKHLRQVISGLNTAGYSPFLCCLLFKGPLADELEEEGYPVETLQLDNILGSNFFQAVLGLSRIIRRRRIDIIHSYLFAANIVSPLAAFLTGIPVITSRRDSGFWKTKRHIYAHRVINLITDRITVNSEDVADYLSRREMVKEEKIVLIHNGLKLPPARPASSVFRENRRTTMIGLMGNIRPIKGYEYFLDAAAKLSGEYSFQVHIAGRVLDPDYFNRLKMMVKDNHLEDRVLFRGEIEDTGSFLKELDIFILPSLSEGFSNSLLEAMANGLAVIATTVGGNREMINNGKDGFLVRPKDPVEIYHRLMDLMTHPELIFSLGSAARLRIEKEFNEQKMFLRLENLYRSLTKRVIN